MKIYKISKNRLIREIDSDLFQGSGCNASTDQNKINNFIEKMKYGWGSFPPIKGIISKISKSDLEEYKEAEEAGYEYELDYSRELRDSDVGKSIAIISDGHNRAYAAKACGIPIKIEVFN